MDTSNPVLHSQTFTNARGTVSELEKEGVMTVPGTIIKTFLLLGLVILGSIWTWNLFLRSGGNPASVSGWLIGGAIVGFILALITTFKPTFAPITAPLYAAAEGIFIGAVSALFEKMFPGIVMQAILLTFGTLAAMLLVYLTGLIRVTNTFRMVVVSATGGIFVAYLLSWILGFFGISVPFISGNGLIGIGFSLVVISVAALNLVLDFNYIDGATKRGIPKYMEWYGAFALMVTLIWLYIEFLRLLAKLKSR